MKFILVILYMGKSIGFGGEFNTPEACALAAKDVSNKAAYIYGYCYQKGAEPKSNFNMPEKGKM